MNCHIYFFYIINMQKGNKIAKYLMEQYNSEISEWVLLFDQNDYNALSHIIKSNSLQTNDIVSYCINPSKLVDHNSDLRSYLINIIDNYPEFWDRIMDKHNILNNNSSDIMNLFENNNRDFTKCPCGANIFYPYPIYNPRLNIIIMVGSTCINYFGSEDYVNISKIFQNDITKYMKEIREGRITNCECCDSIFRTEKFKGSFYPFCDVCRDSIYYCRFIKISKKQCSKKINAKIDNMLICPECYLGSTIKFGKYKRKSYKYVYEIDRRYCDWVLCKKSSRMSKSFYHFYNYLINLSRISKK